MATAQANKTFTDGLAFDANPVNSNFTALKNFANNDLVHLDGTTSLSADLSLGTNKITNLATPTAATDAATKGYADDIVVWPKNHWTMTDGTFDYLGSYSGAQYYGARFETPTTVQNDSSIVLTAGDVSSNTDPFVTFNETGTYVVEILYGSSTGDIAWSPEPGLYYGAGLFSYAGNWSATTYSTTTVQGINNQWGFTGGTTGTYSGRQFGRLQVMQTGAYITFRGNSTTPYATPTVRYKMDVKIYKMGDV